KQQGTKEAMAKYVDVFIVGVDELLGHLEGCTFPPDDEAVHTIIQQGRKQATRSPLSASNASTSAFDTSDPAPGPSSDAA
ncbi:MAG: hypothetical protein Q9188_005989, partial [Gyalolechia gomerana]